MTDAHAHAEGHDSHDVKKHVKIYMMVFAALAVLTVVTVAVSYLHLPMPAAVVLALLIASVKGTLVACYFMHLIGERKAIYATLALTFVFFIVLMFMPLWGRTDQVHTGSMKPAHTEAPAPAHGH